MIIKPSGKTLGAAITEYLLHEGWNVVATYASNNESAKSFFDDQLNICHFYCSEKPETIMLHQKTIFGEINY